VNAVQSESIYCMMCGMNKELIIYTDGGCSGNPGPGGWAFAAITSDGTLVQRSGREDLTTNNKMELKAVIEALKSISGNFPDIAHFSSSGIDKIVIHTDSQYVKNGITTWIHSWERNGWRTAAKKPVKNKEYWVELKQLADRMPVVWKWVPGHAGVEYNELCDAMVQKEISLCLDEQQQH
jgi:ribonuclease HI